MIRRLGHDGRVQVHQQGHTPVPLLGLRKMLVLVSLAIVVSVAFWPALSNGFVNWDDDENFLDNPHFRGLGLTQIRWAWVTFRGGVYQPLGWLLLEVQYSLWGLHPFYYHLMSIVLHILNMIVLCTLTMRFLRLCLSDLYPKNARLCFWAATLATVLFAVHPLRVEAVAWLSCQSYLPCALFSMLSVFTYLQAFETCIHSRWYWFLLTFVLFVIALLFKASAMSLPAVLIILDVYPLRRFGDASRRWFDAHAQRVLFEKLPFVVVSIGFMVLALAAKVKPEIPTDFESIANALGRACYSICFYVWKTVVPLNLTAIYSVPEQGGLGVNWITVSTASVAAVCVLLWVVRARWPGLTAALLIYLVVLAPTSGIVRFSEQIVADRYSYLAMLSTVALVAAGFLKLLQARSLRFANTTTYFLVTLPVLVTLIVLTWRQCRMWYDAQSLWIYAISHGAGSNSHTHANLGLYFQRAGKLERATEAYVRSIQLNPFDISVRCNLGVVFSHRGKLADANVQFREALRLNPNFAAAHYNLAMLVTRQGRYAEAEAHYAKALRSAPDAVDAHYNLALILSQQHRYTEAAGHYLTCLKLQPTLTSAHNNLGTDLTRQGKLKEAEAQFVAALRIDPSRADIHTNLGIVLSHQGKREQAITHYAEALRLDPSYAEARRQLKFSIP